MPKLFAIRNSYCLNSPTPAWTSSKHSDSKIECSIQNMKLALQQTPELGILKLQKFYSIPDPSTGTAVILTIRNTIGFVECVL